MSCTISVTWCCSSGDDREMQEAWKLPGQPDCPSRVVTGLACKVACAGCGLRPWTLAATVLQLS